MTKTEWKRRRRKKIMAVILATLIVMALLIGVVYLIVSELRKSSGNITADEGMSLSVNGVTRTGDKAPLVGIIDVRNSGFKGLTSTELRNRYERADLLNPLMKEELLISAHYAVGTDGTLIEMVPLTERAPGCEDHIAIVYATDERGKLTEAAEKTIDELVKDLCDEYSISEGNINRY